MTEQELNARKKALGYTLEQVAELSGIPLGTVQKIFSGQTRSPRYDTMQKLERVLCPEKASAGLREGGTAYSAKPAEEKPRRCTLEDYYALPEGVRAELLDGVIYVLEAPGTAHQVIALQMGHMLEAHIDANDGSCVPFLSPVDVRFADDAQEVLEPDVAVVCDRNKVHKKEILGAPDLVVEILSPSNTMKRMLIKRNRYIQNGVREYWEIDPEEKTVTVLLLDPQLTADRWKFENPAESGCPSDQQKTTASRVSGGREYRMFTYTFEDQVPVAIWGGACRIDFPKISRRLEALSID